MKPHSAKNKGKALQNYVRDKLLGKFTNLQQEDIRSTGMGQPGADLLLSPLATDVLGCQFECKNLARIAVYNYYDQARTHGEQEPIVVIKQNRSKPLAIMDLDFFISLLKRHE